MDISFLIKGFIVGFIIAAPVGPIGMLCIQRTLTKGQIYGLVTGLGAATADAFYGSIAGFGITFIANFLVSQQVLLRLLGGIFLCYLGVRTILSKTGEQRVLAEGKGLFSAYLSTFFLTVTNPLTILSFAAAFARLGTGMQSGDYVSATGLTLGVFLGSATWWYFLSGSVNLFRLKFKFSGLQWVNRISGVIITGFGISVLLSLKG